MIELLSHSEKLTEQPTASISTNINQANKTTKLVWWGMLKLVKVKQMNDIVKVTISS